MCRGSVSSLVDASAKKASTVPPLAELRAAIPAKCFERSAVRSLALVVRDGLVIAAFAAVATALLRVPGTGAGQLTVLEWLGWLVYAFAQGTAGTGWWVLAHECGHGGFSPSRLLNDIVGWVLHSALLVPYFSWQYSHGKHHSKTNHLLDGESHVPDAEDEMTTAIMRTLHKILGDDCFAILELVNHLLFGWPMYLLFNVTGGRRLNGKEVAKPLSFAADHFRPTSDLFPEAWRFRIALSTLGVGITALALGRACYVFGFAPVAVYYFGPYLFVNFWLVLYTWLQHTDENMPHYGEDEWTWLKGALCTIDRPYGIFDWFHHHIGSTHVCHHVFSALPCYHAVEATKHLKAYLEPRGLYNYDPTPIPLAAWRVAKTCHFVEGVEGTQYYKSFSSSKAEGKKA
mmetsp:Transcript_6009/g.13379  ORF Transcript_6009/g.13379 Transcript_6009/m.13379 type:complete len:401 (+) Transcript_6009:55-1257(+)